MGASFHFLSGRLEPATLAWPSAAGRLVLSRICEGESRAVSPAVSLKYVLEGEEQYEIGGRSYRVAAGRFLAVAAGAQLRAALPARGEAATGLCVYLPHPPGLDPQESLYPLTFAAEGLPLGALLRDAARRIAADPARGPDLAGPVVAAAREAFAALLCGSSSQIAQLDLRRPSTRLHVQRRLELARGHLHDHLDRAVPLTELAREAGLSAFQLARYFTQVYGVPPAAYHRARRLEAADAALRAGQSASCVARDFGFAELSSFTHAYKRHFGVPPSAARRRG